jgi:hypothetical protein
MIKEEMGKVAVGGDRSKLDALEKYRDQYQEQVNILTTRMQMGDSSELLSEQQIQDKVELLCKLPHYGAQLKQIKHVVSNTHGATFREQSHHVRVKAKRWTIAGTWQYLRDGFKS